MGAYGAYIVTGIDVKSPRILAIRHKGRSVVRGG